MNDSGSMTLVELRQREEECARQGDWPGLSETLEALAGQVQEPEERAGLLVRAGLAALSAEQTERAVSLLRRVSGSPFWERVARLNLLELHLQRGEWKEFIEVLDQELEQSPGWDRAALKLEKARLMAWRLGLVEEAVALLEELAGETPEMLEPLLMNLALNLREGAWERASGLYKVLYEKASALGDDALASSLALRTAQVLEHRFRNFEEAEKWYDRVSSPSRVYSLYPCLEFAEALKDQNKAASLLERMMDAAEEEGLAPPPSWRLLLARMKAELLGDSAGAYSQLCALAWENPENFEAIYLAAEAALEEGSPEEKAAFCRQLAPKLADEKESAFFWEALARVQLEDLEDLEAAELAARQWMDKEPDNPSPPRLLLEVLWEAGKAEEARKLIDSLLESAKDPRERQAFLLRKAELCAGALQDYPAALSAFREALQIPPSQFPVLSAMVRVCWKAKDYDNLSRVLAAGGKLIEDPFAQRHYQKELARVLHERLGKADQAFAIYGELIKKNPDDRSVLKAIARLSLKKKSWQNLVGALRRLAESAQDDALKAALLARVAWLREAVLGQEEAAAKDYENLRAKGNGFAGERLRAIHYRGGELPAYLEALKFLEEFYPGGHLKSALYLRAAAAAEILGELADSWAFYEKARVFVADSPFLYLPMIDLALLAGYWARRQALLEEFSGKVSDPARRALLWEAAWSKGEAAGPDGRIDAAGMLEGMRRLEEVSQSWQAALRGQWWAALWAGETRQKAELLARLSALLPEQESLALKMLIAKTLHQELGVQEEAIALYRQVLAKDQKNAPLLRELELLYEQAGQWSELVRMMLLELPLRKDPEVQVAMYDKLAALYEEKFKALGEAVKCHKAVLALKPERKKSHQELVRLLELSGEWEELVNALSAFEAATEEPGEKASLLAKAAGVADERLSDPARAMELLKKALSLDPANQEVLSRLVSLYEREEKYEDLVQALEAQLERVSEPEGKAELHERIAEVLETKLSRAEEAVSHLVAARELAPSRKSVLVSLERLFTALERWEELIDTLERLAEQAEPGERVELLSRVGALWDEKLGNLENAAEAWERVRSEAPEDIKSLEALVSIYERQEDHARFVERAVELARLVKEDKERAVDLLCRAGKAAEEKLADPDQALSLYRRAMEADPASVRPIALARALEERRNNWGAVAELLFQEERITQEPARKAELLASAGRVCEDKLSDQDRAVMAYEKALELEPEYLPAVSPLSEIYFQRGEFKLAGPLFEIRTRLLESESPEVKAEVWFKAGVCKERTGEQEAAEERFKRSVEILPDFRPGLERLSELFAESERWEEAEEVTRRLVKVAEAEADQEARFTFLARLALCLEKQGKLQESAAVLEQALQIKPGDFGLLSRLVGLYIKLEDWNKSLAAYDRLIRSAPSREAAAEGLYGKGVVLADRLRELDSALAHFNKAVEVLPSHLPSWERLAEIHLDRRNWQEAENALLRVLSLEKDQAKLLSHHHRLGMVYLEGMQDLDRAREQFESALKIEPLHIPSMQALTDIYLEQGEWNKFIETGENFVKLVPEESKKELTPLFIKMARVYRDHLDNKERAIINYKTAIKYEPENQEVRSELAALYLSDPKFMEQAKQENLELIRLRPFRFETYRDLAKIYKAQKHLDGQFNIYYIQDMLGELDYEEQMFFEANRDRGLRKSNRTLRDLDRERDLVHPDEKGPLRDMLIAAGDFLGKVFPPPLNQYGARKSNLITEKSTTPIKDLALEVAINLGIEDMNIYLNPQFSEPGILNTDPPSISINTEWFNRFSELEKRFIMGRLIEHCINRHALVFHHPPEKVIRVLCLLAMAIDPSVNLPLGMAAAEVEKQKKNLRKLIPRKAKTQVEHAAQRFTPEILQTDPARWKAAMQHTANRAGLLVCQDQRSAFNAIIKSDPRFQNIKVDELEDPIPVWEKSPEVVELLVFSVSDSYFRLRERLGLSIA